MDLLKMYSLLKMGIFHCHVSLLQGILLMIQKSGFHQLRLVLEIPIIYIFFLHPRSCRISPVNSNCLKFENASHWHRSVHHILLWKFDNHWGFGKAQWRQWTKPSKCIIEVGRGEMASEIIHQMMARCVFSLQNCGKLCCINEDCVSHLTWKVRSAANRDLRMEL